MFRRRMVWKEVSDSKKYSTIKIISHPHHYRHNKESERAGDHQ